jgi:hypothetical protein
MRERSSSIPTTHRALHNHACFEALAGPFG